MVAILPEFAAAAKEIGQIYEAFESTQLELIRLLRHVQQANIASLYGEENLLLKNDHEPTDQVIIPRSRVSSNHERKIRKDRALRTCQRNCCCSCHKTQQIKTPWTWRKSIGVGSMSYSLQQCNFGGCKQSTSSSLRFDYILPGCFLLRMVSIWYNCFPLHGPEFLLRVPVVLPWPKDPPYLVHERYKQAGNEHIDHWLHTPGHLDENGCTLLYVCSHSPEG